MIHLYASQPNYWRHLAPIGDELRRRGHDVRVWASRGAQPWGARLDRLPPGELAVVSSWIDARKLPRSRVVYVEHGAGQTYAEGRPEGYAGAPGLAHVILFIAPGAHVADRWNRSYPQAPVETVGNPALDLLLRAANRPDDEHDEEDHDEGADTDVHRPIVVVSSHWWCGIVPETMPAVPLFERGIRELARLEAVQLVGHAHPRASRRLFETWTRLGIRCEPDPDWVLANSDLLIHDNSSLMYEAAALDVPVLALNAPTYRREVEHGLRFWSHVPGIQCDSVGTFLPAVWAALDDPPEARALRARAAEHVYAHRDGSSTRRAVDAIERVA